MGRRGKRLAILLPFGAMTYQPGDGHTYRLRSLGLPHPLGINTFHPRRKKVSDKLIAKASIEIDAPASEIWKALTDPAMIKEYLFGTEAVSDWKVGSPIVYRGVWEGKAYEDKGKILKMVPGKLLETSYWSGMAGKPDLPENYKRVTYELRPEGAKTLLTVTQDNNATADEKSHSEGNWAVVLGGLKKLLEKP
jgi:uncharacterized protein YndB with AHSA1/START domain